MAYANYLAKLEQEYYMVMLLLKDIDSGNITGIIARTHKHAYSLTCARTHTHTHTDAKQK